jgi:hypothetical protein
MVEAQASLPSQSLLGSVVLDVLDALDAQGCSYLSSSVRHIYRHKYCSASGRTYRDETWMRH